MWFGPMLGWGSGLWMAATLFLLINGGAVIALVLLSRQDRGSPRSSPETPVDIASRRYARGEISKEEFEQIKRDVA